MLSTLETCELMKGECRHNGKIPICKIHLLFYVIQECQVSEFRWVLKSFYFLFFGGHAIRERGERWSNTLLILKQIVQIFNEMDPDWIRKWNNAYSLEVCCKPAITMHGRVASTYSFIHSLIYYYLFIYLSFMCVCVYFYFPIWWLLSL